MKFEVSEYKVLMAVGQFPDDPDEALLAAIDKWRVLAKWHKKHGPAEVRNISAGSCALCELYLYDEYDRDDCEDCPVMERTGWPLCRETPFREYVRDQKYDTALAEYNFLSSLRWTEDDSEAARKLGWDLFNTGYGFHSRLEIQRLDEAGVFDSDGAAIEWVTASADGEDLISLLCRKALEISEQP